MADHMLQPWGYRRREAGREVLLKRPHWEVGVHLGKGVAIVFGDDDTQARLIAAAPIMLKALLAASHALKSYANGNSAPDLAIVIAAAVEDAIAKATKESPASPDCSALPQAQETP